MYLGTHALIAQDIAPVLAQDIAPVTAKAVAKDIAQERVTLI